MVTGLPEGAEEQKRIWSQKSQTHRRNCHQDTVVIPCLLFDTFSFFCFFRNYLFLIHWST